MCSEDFIGVDVVESIKSDAIVHILKDTMIWMNLPVANLGDNATMELLTWQDIKTKLQLRY